MKRRTSAQAIVEFAAVSLLFLLMTFGIIDGGRLVFTYHEVSNAAREGARYAVANGTEATTPVTTSAQVLTDVEATSTGLDPTDLTVTAAWPGVLAAPPDCTTSTNGNPGTINPGCPVSVTVTYQFYPAIGMVFGTGPITLTATSTMIIHY